MFVYEPRLSGRHMSLEAIIRASVLKVMSPVDLPVPERRSSTRSRKSDRPPYLIVTHPYFCPDSTYLAANGGCFASFMATPVLSFLPSIGNISHQHDKHDSSRHGTKCDIGIEYFRSVSRRLSSTLQSLDTRNCCSAHRSQASNLRSSLHAIVRMRH
jgi:hypothetical protein